MDLADVKTGGGRDFGGGGVHFGDGGGGRAVVEAGLQFSESGGGAGGGDFHTAIGEVARPTTDAESGGLLFGPPAEADALHIAGDMEMQCFHAGAVARTRKTARLLLGAQAGGGCGRLTGGPL